MTSQLDDARMEELFSAFDEVSASDAAKSCVLDALADDVPEVRAVPGKRRRPFARVVRIAAAAACVAALSVGGVAYALPASNVTVTVGDESVDLGVNCFGMTVSATAADEEMQQVVDDAQVRNLPYDESIGRVLDSMDIRDDKPVSINVETGDERARERMEARGAEVASEHAPEPSGNLEQPASLDAPSAPGFPGGSDAPTPPDGSDAPVPPQAPGSPRSSEAFEPSESAEPPAPAGQAQENHASDSEFDPASEPVPDRADDQPQPQSQPDDEGPGQPGTDRPEDDASENGRPMAPGGDGPGPADMSEDR